MNRRNVVKVRRSPTNYAFDLLWIARAWGGECAVWRIAPYFTDYVAKVEATRVDS